MGTRLGQNFLSDPKILEKIADFGQIKKGDTVVEIGPGHGSLTQFLLKKAKKVIAIEKDHELTERLKARLNDKVGQEAKMERLEIIEGDVLGIDPKIFPESYILVGNIPYYITGALFKKFLEAENQPKSITFVIQKEVAERILAKDEKESILSLSVKAYGSPELGGIIKAGSFSPAPKVDSAIISIRNINKDKFGEVSEKDFFEFIKRGFAHKRKLLRKNLGIDGEIFTRLGLRKDIRAEDLTLPEWFAIIKACQAKK